MGNNRFKIMKGSATGHCCFEYSIVDSNEVISINEELEHEDDYKFKETYNPICECLSRYHAIKIANALNYLYDTESLSDHPTINGHNIYIKNNKWAYLDNDDAIEKGDYRKCTHCGHAPINGHDHCINNLPGVKYACCGHGRSEGYILFNGGRIIRGIFTSIENHNATSKKDKYITRFKKITKFLTNK